MRNLVLTYMIYAAIFCLNLLCSEVSLAAEEKLILKEEGIATMNQYTPFDQQAIQKLFPNLTVKKAINSSEGERFKVIVVYQSKKPLLTIAPVTNNKAHSKVLCASFLTNSIKNSLGAKIGSDFASIYINPFQAKCIPGMEEMSGLVICLAPNAGNIYYTFTGHWNGPNGTLPPITILKNWTVKQITWLSNPKYSLETHVKCRAINLK